MQDAREKEKEKKRKREKGKRLYIANFVKTLSAAASVQVTPAGAVAGPAASRRLLQGNMRFIALSPPSRSRGVRLVVLFY